MKKLDFFKKGLYLVFPQLRLARKGLNYADTALNCYNTSRKACTGKMQLKKIIGISSMCTLIFIVLVGWVIFPNFLKSKIKGATALKPGSMIREMYAKVPFPLVFKVYMFNITNPVEVAEKGAIPIVQEIGPFVYDEWKEKINVQDEPENDTLTYNIKNTFIFNRELSYPLTGQEVVTIPHPLIAGLVMAVELLKPGALTLMNKAITSIFSNPATPFLTGSVDDILFSGINIMCNVTDFAGKALCTQLKTESADLKEIAPGILQLSFFGPKNGTKAQKIKVKRGINNIHDLGVVVEVDDKPKLDMWTTSACNEFVGTDSTIFAPFLKKEEGLISYAPDLCRSLAAYYVEESKYAGIPVRLYAADFGDNSKNEAEKCYCFTPDTCLKKGVIDLMKCIGAPMYASLPHFYLSDESYVRGVRGLRPKKEDHEIYILFESMTGSPLAAKKRMQFSLPIHAVSKVNTMKNMPDTLLPIFWVEEGVELNSTWTKPLKSLFTTMKVVKVSKYIILVASIGGLAVSAYLFVNQKNDISITAVTNKNKVFEKDPKTNVISMVSGSTNGRETNDNDNDKY